ncbi:MAG: hypothetical protein DI619_04170 [Francisella sp.]|jgi:sugar isomerase, kpsF/gutQ family|nr:MAG: hypothetical protein DI619_04170 [Francisella sp.]
MDDFSSDPASILQHAKKILTMEAQALLDIRESLGQPFIDAVRALLHCQGRIILIGIGKSGHVANKIASTLASTGSPAFFIHPAEAAHGDLGMITSQDVLLLLSNSGESSEIIALLPALKRMGVLIIAITGNTTSTLAKVADIHLLAKIKQEACPLGLAPTTSTTLSLALGDALAICLLQARHFTPDDFARFHPGGSLGKRLLLHVKDLMYPLKNTPVMYPKQTLKEAIIIMTQSRLGIAIIIDKQRHILGIFTDGDLRRLFQKEEAFNDRAIHKVMTVHPQTITADRLASEALHQMQQCQITSLIVVDCNQCLIGVLTMHQLVNAGIA